MQLSVGPLSLGVEEEFLLVVPDSRKSVYRAEPVIELLADLGGRVQRELTLGQIEIGTEPAFALEALGADLRELRSRVAAAAASNGCRPVSVGVPVLDSRLRAPITPSRRYEFLMREYGHLTDGLSVCGCHVHVGIEDREEAAQVSNQVRRWLPTLTAATANSPYCQGRDTGYQSWRALLESRWPVSGPPPYLESAGHYDDLVGALVDNGTVLDPGMVYWQVRLSDHLPTLEFRISDANLTVDDTLLLAALVRALASTALSAVRAGEPAPPVSAELLRAAHWQAARYGLTGNGISLPDGVRRPGWDLFEDLVRQVRPALVESGDWPLVRPLLNRLRCHGSGAERQRRAYRRGGLTEVVDLALDRFDGERGTRLARRVSLLRAGSAVG